MPKNLVIVESPAKAKTIEGYLGGDYIVTSSYGHVRDLPKDDKAIDVENGFKPTYEIPKDKKEVISNLRKLVKDSSMVYLASDDDREGEAISWHLKEALKLDDDKVKRIVFHEITKKAITKAIESPRGIDIDLVNAQQARRVLDRLVGFEISPVLWKKIKAGLSAGRVQSVAVRLIVEREREIEKFTATSQFKVSALFTLEDGKQLKAELNKKFATEDEVVSFLNDCKGSDFKVDKLEKKPAKKSPAAPFTTSTLQQEASRKLGYSVSQTMSIAQRLYESGKISYMRTDSVNLSEEAIEGAKAQINQKFGNEFSNPKQFANKNKSAQEAHEAIRPTDFSVMSAGSNDREEKLYELIWKRTIASQMADAQLERTTVGIGISKSEHKFVATGEVVKFEGFLKVYIESTDDEEDEKSSGIIPPIQVGEQLQPKEISSREVFTRPPARYTEASLVRKLEEMGIGRPSTYAPTITTIQKREYVVKDFREGRVRNYVEFLLKNDQVDRKEKNENTGAEKNKLFPTSIAMVVNDFLTEYFPNVIDYSFTANVEKEFDSIAAGQVQWNTMIDKFYGGFHNKVEQTTSIDRAEINKSRELGVDPNTGKKVYTRLARFGPVVQLGENEGEEKAQFASLRKGQLMENITLEDALELFKLPRKLGQFEEKEIDVNIGRFGPYIRHNSKFVSIPKEEDIMTITTDRAIELIVAKRETDAKKLIKAFEEDDQVQVLNGRWGPYIKFGKLNVKIPKDKVAEDLTYEDCVALSKSAPAKKGKTTKKK